MATNDPSRCSDEDISEFVVHFVRGKDADQGYQDFLSVCYEGVLCASKPVGIGKKRRPGSQSQYAVCFSEIPPGQWRRLRKRRKSAYGFAFRKNFVIDRGGGPIWYVWKNSPCYCVLQDMMKAAAFEPRAEIWRLTPFIDAPGNYRSGSFFFDWEREWRHIGDFCFQPNDVAFLLIPERFHDQARDFFEDAGRNNTGPCYSCPYVDPAWPRDRVIEALQL